MPLITIETKADRPARLGKRRVVIFSQVVRLNLPGEIEGGLIWNRPTAVLIQEPDGSEHTIPVQDITRQAQIFLIGLGLFGAFIIWLAKRGRQRPHSQEE